MSSSPPGARHDLHLVDDLEDLDDLDAEDGADGAEHPRSHQVGASGGPPLPVRRVGWLRRRWALPVVVALLVVLVGTAAVRQARAAATAELQLTRQLAAVQVGGASIVVDGRDTRDRDDDGRLRMRVQITVFNSGRDPVRVSARELSLAHADLVGPPAAASVRPSSSSVLGLWLAVDCGAVPPVQRDSSTPAEAGGAAQWLRLDVASTSTGEGSTRSGRYLIPDQPWSSLPEQLSWACDPSSSGELSATLTPTDDGRLSVEVVNGSDGVVRIALDSSPALNASADVALPSDVAAHARLTTTVGLTPDCSSIGAPSEGGLDLHVDVVRLVDGYSETEQLTWESQGTAWAARQVALTCG